MRPVASLTVPYVAAVLVITSFPAFAQTAGPPAPPAPVFYDLLHLQADQVGKIINTLDRYNQVISFFQGERATSIDVVIGELQKQVQEQNVKRAVADQQAKAKADAEAKVKADAEAKGKARDEHDRKHLVPTPEQKKIPPAPEAAPPAPPAPDASSPPPNDPPPPPADGDQPK